MWKEMIHDCPILHLCVCSRLLGHEVTSDNKNPSDKHITNCPSHQQTSRPRSYLNKHHQTSTTYSFLAVFLRRVAVWSVQGAPSRPQSSPRRPPGALRVPEAERAQHPALLPLFEQLQLTQAGQAGLQPLLIPTALRFHGQRESREQDSKRARELL